MVIGERRIRIVGRLGLVHGDCGVHRGAAAGAMRLACESWRRRCESPRRRRDVADRRECRQRLGASAAVTSSSVCPAWPHGRPRRSSDRAATASSPAYLPSGTKTWKKRWARPSLLTNVPSASAKVPAESTTSARAVVSCQQVIDHDDVRARHPGSDSTAARSGRVDRDRFRAR